MSSVNLKRLAQELNLSISAVSKALRDSHEIAVDTKERVRALARELRYEPNPHASSLRRQKSKTIGVVIPEVANSFFSLVINGIEEVARHNGYHVLIYLTHEDHTREAAIAQYLANGRVDGILMSVASESADFAHLQELKNKNIPIVFFDRVCEEMATVRVTTNDFESGYKATQHLLEAGCRRIAYLLISEHLSIGQKRMQGYQQALEDHAIPFDANLIVSGHQSNEHNRMLIQQLLETQKVDGIFASVERLAISSYEACKALNLSIPGDVKIIGFSNLEIASLLDPPLTAIKQPAYAMGREAACILFTALDKNRALTASQSLVLNSELIERKSTARN
ncbi:LacI family DNA-binding transcriptional regulator [Hymenobacter jejuensis]|uniref:LacI family transcriptional regulator n=1 Tax=Hymenobacter jejuensis TaxID=2502781 RepID=A0A5B7ZWK2_9BACT|nr:LacI family DNA-binding transcriptional regulator [Hymenobacter jejuensis]QDA59237.1 LacI family transcriptional regulator [Hymenobacter jejuensis]